MIPQIDTAEQARAAVSAAKFSPIGTRGTCRFVRSAGFGAVPGSEYFDGTLISADVKLVKPCAEIYELLYSTFGLIPGECLFIDDSAPNIEGAERTGMPGIVFHGDADELRSEMNAFGVNI